MVATTLILVQFFIFCCFGVLRSSLIQMYQLSSAKIGLNNLHFGSVFFHIFNIVCLLFSVVYHFLSIICLSSFVVNLNASGILNQNIVTTTLISFFLSFCIIKFCLIFCHLFFVVCRLLSVVCLLLSI